MPKFCLLLLFAAAWMAVPAEAATAPDLPLPPCVNGQGACAVQNPLFTATATPARLVAGQSVLITTEPENVVCDGMDGYNYIWTPSPCFAGVAKPVILTCAYIDLRTMRFVHMHCQQALYKNPAEAPEPLFTLMRPAGNTDYTGSTQCGAAGNYQTYAWGGPATNPEAVWRARGDRARFCELSMAGKRPDGLYGPTWAKVQVGIVHGEDGLGRGGRSEYAEFYIPIDGDLRSDVDVAVMVTHQLGGSDGAPELQLQLLVENKGGTEAENVEVVFQAPKELHVIGANDNSCTRPAQFSGGTLRCTFSLPGKDTRFIDVDTRILNAADLDPHFTVTAIVANDADPTNNEGSTHAQLNLRQSSWSETMQLMEALLPYFDYKTPDSLLNTQCDRYMNDIYARLNGIREQHPEVFANLAFGRVTSGRYRVAGVMDAGHVGVVVYPKGTDYHETGIIIHGTPTWSPADLDIEARMGTMPMGDHMSLNFIREGTADHGLYYRTRIRNFPGNPKPEVPIGCGFEGAYADNEGDFAGSVPSECRQQSFPEAKSCPFFPDAVMLRTESPVDLRITNSKGQRVHTSGGEISLQELDNPIFAYPVPHDDGTYGWTIVLPRDRYDVQLEGVGDGPYKLTMRNYDADGKRVDEVIEGDTVPGRVDVFVTDGTAAAPGSGNNNNGNTGGGNTGGGGGGPMDPRLLLGLGLFLLLVAARRRLYSPSTSKTDGRLDDDRTGTAC